MTRNIRDFRILRPLFCFVLAASLACVFAGSAFAQSAPHEVKTLFVISHQAAFAGTTYPLTIWDANGNALTYVSMLEPESRGSGAISVAVDADHEHLFITCEDTPRLDVINALSGERLQAINLSGTSDLAGIDILESRGELFVIDRRQKDIFVFDTVTYASLSHWVLPSGDGAFDIQVRENVSGHDVIFVSDGTPTVRWYDIDTHAEVGSASFTDNAMGLGVDNTGSDPWIFSVCHDPGIDDPFPEAHDFIQKLDVGSNQQTQNVMDSSGRGVEVNEVEKLVYVTVGMWGTWGNHMPTVRVFSSTNLQQVNSYDQDFCGTGGIFDPFCTPTGIAASRLAFGTRFEKELTSHPGGSFNTGEQVVFTVTITNESSSNIHVLPMVDTYDKTQISYDYSVPASTNNTDDGTINWSNIITQIGGDLGPDESTTVEMHFVAVTPPGCETYEDGENTAEMTGAQTDQGNDLPDAIDTAAYRLNCVCQEDGDCDDGLWCNGEERCVRQECVPGETQCEDDGEFCNGEETCNENRDECVTSDDPCPDNGVFCDGEETCDESRDRCEHAGDPCADETVWCLGPAECDEQNDECLTDQIPCTDDGIFCNGDETCDQDTNECIHLGDPCLDDGEWCNGLESCNEDEDQCDHTGDPCPDGEACDEDTHECVPFNTQDDDTEDTPVVVPDTPTGEDEDEAGWPEGKVTGGCCGCG